MLKKTYYLDPYITVNSWEEFIEHFSGYVGTEIFGKISEIKMKPRIQTLEGKPVIKLELEVSYQPPEFYIEDNSY